MHLPCGWFNWMLAGGAVIGAALGFFAAYEGAASWWTFAFFLLVALGLVLNPELETRVNELHITDTGLRRRFGPLLRKKKEECVTWEELWKVEVLTTDDGPWLEDFYFVLIGENRGVLVSIRLATKHGLASILQKHLPGFDSLALAEASGCTENRGFTVWLRPNNSFKPKPLRGSA